jgi:hypothetical protein
MLIGVYIYKGKNVLYLTMFIFFLNYEVFSLTT